MRIVPALACGLLVALVSACDNQTPSSGPASKGGYSIERLDFNGLTDPARNRDVPTSVYFPRDAAGPFPLVLLSHGLGGDRSHYVYLAKHLARHGYVVAVPEHVGSSSRLNIGQLATALVDMGECVARRDDLSFLIDEATQWNVLHPKLGGKIDLASIGVTGHSFGGGTAQWIGGAQLHMDGDLDSVRDARVKAILPMAGGSTPDTQGYSPWFSNDSFDDLDIPCMHIVGTDDDWLGKKGGYNNSPKGDKFYVALQNVDHFDFTDAGDAKHSRKASANRIICALGTAFFDRYLRGGSNRFLKESWADDQCDWQVPNVIWFDK